MKFRHKPLPKPMAAEQPELAEKPKARRWQVFGVITAAAMMTVVYVNNSVRVNELLRDRDRLRRSLDSVRNSMRSEQMRVIRLQSAERIDSIARNSLHMIRNPKAPKTIIVPAE
jgi:cell division protein FtsL